MTNLEKNKLASVFIQPSSEMRRKVREEWNNTEGICWQDYLLDRATTPHEKIPFAAYVEKSVDDINILEEQNLRFLKKGYYPKFLVFERGGYKILYKKKWDFVDSRIFTNFDAKKEYYEKNIWN